MTVPKFKIFRIKAYKPGRSTLGKLKNITKLSANESALGVSPKAKKALKTKNLNLSKYPDSKAKFLRKEISKKFNCDLNKIICGAGSDEIIQMICQLFLNPKDEVILPQYSFLMYRIYANIVGGKVLFAKEKNYKISISEILKKVTKKTKIIFLANPNNPTGTYIDKNELISLRKKLRNNILLVIDDAYFDRGSFLLDKPFIDGVEGRLRHYAHETEERAKRIGELVINKRVLDFGCGAGALISKLDGLAKSIEGIEPTDPFRLWLQEKGMTIYKNISEASGDYDVVLMFHVLELYYFLKLFLLFWQHYHNLYVELKL